MSEVTLKMDNLLNLFDEFYSLKIFDSEFGDEDVDIIEIAKQFLRISSGGEKQKTLIPIDDFLELYSLKLEKDLIDENKNKYNEFTLILNINGKEESRSSRVSHDSLFCETAYMPLLDRKIIESNGDKFMIEYSIVVLKINE